MFRGDFTVLTILFVCFSHYLKSNGLCLHNYAVIHNKNRNVVVTKIMLFQLNVVHKDATVS